jgi:hypothetical protein
MRARPDVSRDARELRLGAEALADDGAGRRSSDTATRGGPGWAQRAGDRARAAGRASPTRRPVHPEAFRSRPPWAFARQGVNTSAWGSDGVATRAWSGKAGVTATSIPYSRRYRATGQVVVEGAEQVADVAGPVGWQRVRGKVPFAGTPQRCIATVTEWLCNIMDVPSGAALGNLTDARRSRTTREVPSIG